MNKYAFKNENSPLKVLYVTHYGKLYGANRSMLDMILELRSKYNIIPYVLLNEHGDLEKELQKNQIEYFYMKYYGCAVLNDKKYVVQVKRIIKRIICVFSYPFIVKKLGNDFDIIHSNSSIVDIGYFISKKLQCKHVWHIREYGWEDFNLTQIDKLNKVKERYINTDVVIAVSKSIEEKIKSIDKRIAVNVVYNGVHLSNKYEKRYLEDNKIHFCIVGVISKNKNQMEGVRAVKYLRERGYENFCLHIVGGDSGDGQFSEIKQYVNEMHLEKYVDLMGYRYDVNELLKRMDIGIMSSKKEAFGRVTIEYMGNYMPVIGTNTGGTKELIENEKNGFLYHAGDSMDLAQKMEKFVSELHLLGNMGLYAREFAEKFTADINADYIYKIYKNP